MVCVGVGLSAFLYTGNWPFHCGNPVLPHPHSCPFFKQKIVSFSSGGKKSFNSGDYSDFPSNFFDLEHSVNSDVSGPVLAPKSPSLLVSISVILFRFLGYS